MFLAILFDFALLLKIARPRYVKPSGGSIVLTAAKLPKYQIPIENENDLIERVSPGQSRLVLVSGFDIVCCCAN